LRTGGEVAGHERFDEGVVKGEDVLEVAGRVGVVFAEDAGVDEVEDDLAEVVGGLEAPFVEDGLAHRAVFLEGEFAQAVEEFLAGNMPVGVLAAALERLERVVETFLDEVVGVGE
jgi:hypothetical protein